MLSAELDIPEQTIGASYGDALLGAIGTGLVPPDTDYLALYPATRDQMHRLARMQEAALAD